MLNLKFSMVTGIRHHFLALWRNRDGVAAIVMAIFLPVLVVIAALVIDMSYAYWTRTQLQHAATVDRSWLHAEQGRQALEAPHMGIPVGGLGVGDLVVAGLG